MKGKSKKNIPSSNFNYMDSKIRKIIQDPKRIVKKYVKEGMSVLDVGCGPGLFSFEMAKIVGPKGKIIATDIQQEMLDKLKNKISRLEIEKRIKIHKCEKNKIGLNKKFDFVLAFYVAHEVENKDRFFNELNHLMKKGKNLLIAEPIFHVSKNNFEETLEKAEKQGFKIIQRPKGFLSRFALLTKN
jgi:ubiquinone/menaquinone biosynthesis C-methylase UbiE